MVEWGVGDGFDETMGNKDTQNFLDSFDVMGTGVVEEGVAVILGI